MGGAVAVAAEGAAGESAAAMAKEGVGVEGNSEALEFWESGDFGETGALAPPLVEIAGEVGRLVLFLLLGLVSAMTLRTSRPRR